MTNPHDDMLDSLFAEARATSPCVSDDLMARVMADAVMAQQTEPVVPVKIGIWEQLLDMVGGWTAVSGLAAATVAGIWVGIAPPASVADFTTTLIGSNTVEHTVSIDIFTDTDSLTAGFLADG